MKTDLSLRIGALLLAALLAAVTGCERAIGPAEDAGPEVRGPEASPSAAPITSDLQDALASTSADDRVVVVATYDVVALMQEGAGGALSPDSVKSLLVGTADPMEGYEPYQVGAGMVNALEAVGASPTGGS